MLLPLICPTSVILVLDEFKDVQTNELVLGGGASKQSSVPAQPKRVSWAKELLTELLARGYVRPSKSSFGASVHFVSKNGGQLRMWIDYRALNRVTVRNNYHLPRVDDLLNMLADATYFNQIDLKSDYYQIRIAAQDVHKTAMRTRYGSYEFLVMSFGLCNAPATFMSIINDILTRKWMSV